MLLLIGSAWMDIVLLINMVLILNFVIAILSSVYASYEDKKSGLYYEVLISHFPAMEFDEKYGSLAIAIAPFNLLIIPFSWIYLLPLSDESLTKFNYFLCKILYFPVAISITIIFTIINVIIIPFAYVFHIITLINTLTNRDETMDDMKEKIRRFCTILKFMVFGPLILIQSIPVDTYVFLINLFTKAYDADKEFDLEMFDQRSFEILENCSRKTLKETNEKLGRDE